MNRTAAMDRRVQFFRGTMIDDGHQSRVSDFRPHGFPVWAQKSPVSDGERFRADAVARDNTDRFQVRWSAFTSAITAADRLKCEGVTYGISGIKEIGRRERLEITAHRLSP
ncbi:phage head closure protein [Falsirhodobacter halotolerans]|uniref:phage head closure protein n=1 Tax=Falsirhodobacter halotolerans TaxID=1146892 RepID=UPI001FD1B801|nr:phage head closure protein [Falsirhodobacter halotolerans]MCJ8138429.1 phage head closure protein [Falsirhodobacter halotolerans]